MGLNPCAAIFRLLAATQAVSELSPTSGSFYYGFALCKNVEANKEDNVKPLSAQNCTHQCKGAERAATSPLEDLRAPFICSQRTTGLTIPVHVIQGTMEELGEGQNKANQQFPV